MPLERTRSSPRLRHSLPSVPELAVDFRGVIPSAEVPELTLSPPTERLDDFEDFVMPDVPTRNPSDVSMPENTPVPKWPDVGVLRSAIGGFLEDVKQLQQWFEVTMAVLRHDLQLIRQLESLIEHRHADTSRGRPTGQTEGAPANQPSSESYAHKWDGLFLVFLVSRLQGRVWRLFGGPAGSVDCINSPVILVSTFLKILRLACVLGLQASDGRRPRLGRMQEFTRTRLVDHNSILCRFRNAQRYQEPFGSFNTALCDGLEHINKYGRQEEINNEFDLHYRCLLDLVRSDELEFSQYALSSLQKFNICAPNHPKPSKLIDSVLDIIEDVVWTRFQVEYAHARHHYDLTFKMRLNKGGAKKGSAIYGLRDATIRELAEIYSGSSDVFDSILSDCSNDIERHSRELFNKIVNKCKCEKVFHIHTKTIFQS